MTPEVSVSILLLNEGTRSLIFLGRPGPLMKYVTQNTTLGGFDLITVFVNCYSLSSHPLPDAQHRVYMLELIRGLLRALGALARLARVRCQSESQRTISNRQLQFFLKVQLA